MTPEEERQVVAVMRQALQRSRGHASFFEWAPNRDLEEWGVANHLHQSLVDDGADFYQELAIRGRGNDPPDCEARSREGDRIAIEVTELVDPAAILAFKRNDPYHWTDWSQTDLREALQQRLLAKDKRGDSLQGGPYGQYVVIVHTDEPMLSHVTAGKLLEGVRFSKPCCINRAFLLISYDPGLKRCPYLELPFDA